MSSKRARVVIVGAGLGGSLVADVLARELGEDIELTVIEQGAGGALSERVHDVGAPAGFWPHAGGGLGGSTGLWHNGLKAVAPSVLEGWPIDCAEMQRYVEKVFPILAGAERSRVEAVAAHLRELCIQAGLPADLLGQPLIYPARVQNIWNSLGLAGRVKILRGSVQPLKLESDGRVTGLQVKTAAGLEEVAGEVFVLAAGGLGTPLLLAGLSPHAGRFYEDHPCAFVAELNLKPDLYELWNHRESGFDGTVRMGLNLESSDLSVSFYLRPLVLRMREERRDRLVAALRALRHRPLQPGAWLGAGRDALGLLSLKLGLGVPKDRFLLMLAAGQSPSRHVAIFRDQKGLLTRDWRLEPTYLQALDEALAEILQRLATITTKSRILPGWHQQLTTGSHHSGTARLAKTAQEGVCDSSQRVFGTSNVFVADGSLIPGSGTANTGLAIGALALRLGDRLVLQLKQGPPVARQQVDVVISGASGFVGGKLRPILEDCGLSVVTASSFERNPTQRARLFINLANVHGSPAGNLELFERHLASAGHRVDRWVQVQSCATLVGPGGINLGALNAGFRPLHIDLYSAGKLLQEERALQALASGELRALTLAYFGHVIDPGGNWASTLRQAKAHGYVLPEQLPPEGRANILTVPEIAQFLVGLLGVKTALPSPHRALVSSELARDLTWERCLGENRLRAQKAPALNLVGRLKWAVRTCAREVRASGLTLLWYAGLLQPVLRKLGRHRVPARGLRPAENPPGQGPVRFEGFDAEQMLKQPYLRAGWPTDSK